jgi:hypothetical protein
LRSRSLFSTSPTRNNSLAKWVSHALFTDAGDVVGHAAYINLLRGVPLFERVVISSKKVKDGGGPPRACKDAERRGAERRRRERSRRRLAYSNQKETRMA